MIIIVYLLNALDASFVIYALISANYAAYGVYSLVLSLTNFEVISATHAVYFEVSLFFSLLISVSGI